MTKKDYELIASVLRATKPDYTPYAMRTHGTHWSNTVDQFAQALTADNSRFDRKRFLAACGVVVDHPPGRLRTSDPIVDGIVRKLYGDD